LIARRHLRKACRCHGWSYRRMFFEILAAAERRYAASSPPTVCRQKAWRRSTAEFNLLKDRDANAVQERMAYHLFPDGGDYRTAS